MSGIIGHTMYAVLAAMAAERRRSPVAPLVGRHWPSYLAGSYLGCDVQTMPEAICNDSGNEVGYGTAPLKRSPLTGGDIRPFYLTVNGRRYRPIDIHHLFYGRAHLTFGYTDEDWQCRESLRARTGGLSYSQMVAEAGKSRFRHALEQIADAIADLFDEVVFLVPELRRMDAGTGLNWTDLLRT